GTYGLISAEGILEGEKADEAILWLSHPGITTRYVEDTAILLNVLAEPHDATSARDFRSEVRAQKRLRVGITRHFNADPEVSAAFDAAVEIVRTLGHDILAAGAPFDMPPFGDLHAIEADRKAISERAFTAIDVLLVPTTTTTVPRVDEARANARRLSAANTMF